MAYTADEMREMADLLESKAEFEAAAMLRQAAEAMDRQKALDELAAESQRLGLYSVGP